MKIALITDTHWGVRNDSLVFLDYFEKFYNNVFFPELEKRDIKTIVHLGDIVDRRKYINYVTLKRMREVFIERCKTDNIDLHVIIGNHDVPFKNTNDINSMGELFTNYGFKYYSEPHTAVFGDTKIILMPWINNTNYGHCMEYMNRSDAKIVFGHFEIAGCLMDRTNVNDHGLKIEDFRKFDTVCSGHFHHKSTTKNIHYLGCPYELTWSDYKDPKGFHIFDTETFEIEFVKNPYTMFNKVYYNDGDDIDGDFEPLRNTYVKVVKQSMNDPYKFDMFMDNLLRYEPVHVQIVDDHLKLNLEDDSDIVNEAEDTLTILDKYVDEMDKSVPSTSLKAVLRSIYSEAIHMET